MNGFYINKLVVGNGSKQAILDFRPGANLVTGASDTGKSYIFSSINYALGRSAEPKEFNESIGYNDFVLVITAYNNNQTYSLHRKLGQKDIAVTSGSVENIGAKSRSVYTTTGAVDSPKHISTFLLSLANMDGKKLLKNKKKGVTQNLSIKNILSLTFINEMSIIKETSPFWFSEQYSDRILSQSLLHLILTGEDFSETIEIEDQAIKETRINGKLEFLTAQISHFAAYREKLVEKFDQVVDHSDREQFLKLDLELQRNLSEARELTEQKNKLLVQKENIQKEKSYNNELQKRLAILERQYRGDVERLDFILEAKTLSDQLGDTVCPLCSAPLTNNHFEHIKEKQNFNAAAAQELEKYRSKLVGLQETLRELSVEDSELNSALEKNDRELQSLNSNLSNNFSNKIQGIKSDLKEFLEVESMTNEIAFVDKQVKALFEEKNRLEKQLNSKEDEEETSLLSYTLLSELAETIEKRLQAWNYESLLKVNFNSDYKIFDIVISGKNRKSYGKGKRSISYAACLIGLLDFCNQRNLSFTNVILMDSPLTTFEEKKKKVVAPKDLLATDVLNSFFKDIINLPEQSQVIILDNKEPNEETYKLIRDRLNMVVFTGTTENGRAGFFEVLN